MPAGLPNLLSQILPMLQQHAAQGSNEMDVFEDLADWFEDEGVDEALPVIAGVAARAAIRPIVRRTGTAVGRTAARQVVRSATQATQTLVRRQGPQADEEDSIDAAAPVIAGLTIRRTVPGVSRMSRPARRRLVRSVTQATRTIARRQGPQAARAVPSVVRAVQRGVRQRRIPAQAAPRAIQRTAQRVARSPQAVRRLSRAVPVVGRRSTGVTCPSCRRRRRFTLRAPVTISIQGR